MLKKASMAQHACIPPVVTDTTVAADLLQKLQVITKLGVQGVGQQLHILAVALVLLSVEEPVRNLVLARVLHDADELVDLVLILEDVREEA
jgi:hypothetical protein